MLYVEKISLARSPMKKTLTLYPDMDTYIDSSIPKHSFYNKDFYFVGYFKCCTIYRILMKFDTGIIPKDTVIEKAVLRLYCTRNDNLEQDNIFEIHPILEPWQSYLVSYENQPRCNEKSIPMKAEFSLCESIYTDITGLVKEWREYPETNYGFLMKAADETDEESLIALTSSRQGYAEWKPCIELSLEIPEQPADENNTIKKVAIVTPQFLEWDGEKCLFGGGERYLAELAELIMSMGCEVDVFQPSNGPAWQKEYSGFKVYGVGDGGFDEDFFVSLNKKFYSLTKDYDLHIYLSMDLTCPYVFPNSICVSHGIWWDSTERPWWRSERWYKRLYDGLNRIDTLVCVDTNTINWLNATNPEIKCTKEYVPNYVDLDIFKPELSSLAEEKEVIRVVYPRRLVAGRGWCATKEVAKELVKERKDISFSFVGRGLDCSEEHMKIFASKYPRIEYTWYPMEKMKQAYRNADIVLIPSYYTEGTSFSLLEAMACGKPVIAGLVGGLTDLVINGYNGLLIQVSKDTLKDGILKLADDKKLREEMGKNAQQIAQCFSKRLWEKRWKEIIKSHL